MALCLGCPLTNPVFGFPRSLWKPNRLFYLWPTSKYYWQISKRSTIFSPFRSLDILEKSLWVSYFNRLLLTKKNCDGGIRVVGVRKSFLRGGERLCWPDTVMDIGQSNFFFHVSANRIVCVHMCGVFGKLGSRKFGSAPGLSLVSEATCYCSLESIFPI